MRGDDPEKFETWESHGPHLSVPGDDIAVPSESDEHTTSFPGAVEPGALEDYFKSVDEPETTANNPG